jgi:two-component system response regulator NreC
VEGHLKTIRVLLADDHPVVRAGLRAFLESEQDMQVVGEAETGWQAVALAQELGPDVVVMDISMPGNGLDATRQIRSLCPETQVLILTIHAQEYYLFLVLKAGAAGYVLKSTADTELVGAIRAVAQGGAFLYPSGAKMLVEDYLARLERSQVSISPETLSDRELEVLKFIALGYTASEAADALALSPKSVETYRARIMQKLDLHSRVELVQYALLHGLLTESVE